MLKDEKLIGAVIISIPTEDVAEVGVTNPRSILQHGREYWLKVAGRAAGRRTSEENKCSVPPFAKAASQVIAIPKNMTSGTTNRCWPHMAISR